jgi:hypothetical protein
VSGEIAAADPHTYHLRPAKLVQSGQEILRCLLIGEPADRAHHRRVGGKTERAPRPFPGLRRADLSLRPRRGIHGHPDGPDPIGGDQAAADGLDRHAGPDAKRNIGDAAQPALDRDVGAATAAGLELVEREAMVGVHDPRHLGAPGGQAAERPGLGSVGVCHVEPSPAQPSGQRPQRAQVAAGIDGHAQRGLGDHLQARCGRLVQQVIPAPGDDRDLEPAGVERLRAAQREHARPALQSSDEGSHSQRTGIHQLEQPPDAMEFSRDQ